jgi:hypothetical protein
MTGRKIFPDTERMFLFWITGHYSIIFFDFHLLFLYDSCMIAV